MKTRIQRYDEEKETEKQMIEIYEALMLPIHKGKRKNVKRIRGRGEKGKRRRKNNTSGSTEPLSSREKIEEKKEREKKGKSVRTGERMFRRCQ